MSHTSELGRVLCGVSSLTGSALPTREWMLGASGASEGQVSCGGQALVSESPC